MNHFYEKIQKRTFFNFHNVYDKLIKESSSDAHFVEVGVWRGQSICYAAVEIINANKNIKIDAVDTWLGSPEQNLFLEDGESEEDDIYDIFLKNIEPVKNIITPIRMTSVEASKLYEDRSLDFVFIDASHLYENVKDDIEHWLPKIKVGGYIGGHDYSPHEPEEKNGVKKAVDEIFGKNIELFNQGWCSWLHKVL
jgi:hypothetical protein